MNGVPQEVLDNQPKLHIDPVDEARNGVPIEIKYCINKTETTTCITYVYVWTFSDTPLIGELFGYPDHDWDYEPVIVCIDNATGAKKLIHSTSHYRASVTTSEELEVTKNTHGYSPTTKTGGKTFPVENFKEMTEEQLRLMNNALSGIPRLPFHPELSLNWACKDPLKVEKNRYFSSDTKPSRVPPQTNGVGGAALGAGGGAAAKGVASGLGLKALAEAGVGGPAVVGAVSGLAGGVVGGAVSEAVQNAGGSKATGAVVGTLAAAGTGALVGAAIGSVIPGVGTAAGAVIGGICGGIGGLITSLW